MIIYLLLLTALFLIELGYFKLADYYNIIDKPNDRSSHTKITLRGGGIIFYISILIYFLFEGFQYPWFLAGLTLISLISFADDIKPQSSKFRLVIHFVSMGLMFYQWNLFSLPWYFAIIALVFCTGVLNAYNFMDGINGITGGYSLVVVASLWYINTYIIKFVDSNLIYFISASLIVFNFFNFRKKAKCFAGDIGSISIAFIVLFMLGKLILLTNDFSYIFLLTVYGVDSVLTIIHRIFLRENIFEPHRKHVFQLMANELKIPHLLVSLIYMLIQGLICVILLSVQCKLVFSISILALLSFGYILFKYKYYGLHKL